jgi:hypothetical protein
MKRKYNRKEKEEKKLSSGQKDWIPIFIACIEVY